MSTSIVVENLSDYDRTPTFYVFADRKLAELYIETMEYFDEEDHGIETHKNEDLLALVNFPLDYLLKVETGYYAMSHAEFIREYPKSRWTDPELDYKDQPVGNAERKFRQEEGEESYKYHLINRFFESIQKDLSEAPLKPSAVVKTARKSSRSGSGSGRRYVDNKKNRELGRVGKPY